MRDLKGLKQIFNRDRFNSLSQRHMNTDKHHPQARAGQHHANRHATDGHTEMGGRKRLQHFCVSWKNYAAELQGLFVEWCCDECSNFAL